MNQLDSAPIHVSRETTDNVGGWVDVNKKLCAMEPRLRLERFPPRAGLEPGTARSIGQPLTY